MIAIFLNKSNIMVKKLYDFEEFYKIGEELSKIDDEAHARSSINRDYYALFGESRRYLVEVRGKKYLKSKKRIHKKVCDALRFSRDPTEEYIGKILYMLKTARGFADYDWNEKDVDYFKEMLIQAQKEVPNGLESLKYLNNKYNNN